MARPSRYPGFHKYVNKVYLAVICTLSVLLPILYITIKQPSLKNTMAIIICVIISYFIYWLIVRLNCYGTPNTLRSTSTSNNNSNRPSQPPPPPSRSDSSTSSRSSTNGGSSSNTNNNHPTFASYRLGRLAEMVLRFGGNGNNNGGASNTNDDSCEVGGTLRPPPPTYDTALEGAGLPPPYMNDSIEINVHNSESPQMSETPRRSVPSVQSSSSLRRPVPPIPQQQSSTQSTQDPTSPIISDSIPQSPRRPVPPIPSSPSSSSVPSISAFSSSTLPPRLHKSISHDSNVNNNRK